MGASGVGGRSSAGSGGFPARQRCRVCSGELCGWCLHLYEEVSGIVGKCGLLQKDGRCRFYFCVGMHQPCAAPIFRLGVFGAAMLFRDVFPPVEGRPPFFLRPRGTALVVRLAVCCFWPAIAPDGFRGARSDRICVVLANHM